MPTAPIVGVVADANVLLSAITGRGALRVFTEHDVVVHVAEFNAEEVREYLPAMAARYDLDAAAVELQWTLLPKRIHSFDVKFAWAMRALAKRDPEDAHALALGPGCVGTAGRDATSRLDRKALYAEAVAVHGAALERLARGYDADADRRRRRPRPASGRR